MAAKTGTSYISGTMADSRYNDTLSCFGKPKGSMTMSQKVTVFLHCLLGNFPPKLLLPPIAGMG